MHDTGANKFRHRKSSLWNIKIDTRPQTPSERKISAIEPISFDQRDTLKHLLEMNRFIIWLSNQVASLQVPFRRFTDDKSLIGSKKVAYYLAYARFYWFALILVRLICAAIFNSCDYSRFRYYIYDWTVYYPSDRRSDLMRCFIALCCIQLTLKRSVFFKKPLDASLIDYLCNLPDKSTDRLASDMNTARMYRERLQEQDELVPPNGAQRRMSMDYQSFSRYLDAIDAGKSKLREDLDMDVVAPELVFYKDSLYDLIEDPRLCYAKFDNDMALEDSVYHRYNRNQNHWLEVSERLEFTFRRVIAWLVPMGTLVCLASCFRIAYLLDIHRACDPRPPLLRLVGTVEIMLCLGDFSLSLIGMIMHVVTVIFDLRYQARRVERDLSIILKQLDSEINKSGKSFDEVTEFLDYKDQADSIVSRSMSRSPILDDTDDLNEEVSDEFQIADASIRSFEKSVLQFSKHRGNNISLPNLYEHRSKMSLNEGQDKNLRVMQLKVIGFLSSMDRQKQLFSLAGEAQYMWLVSTLPFVPLLVKSLIQGTVIKHLLPNLIYLILVIYSVTFTILLTTAGARINQRVSPAAYIRPGSSHRCLIR